MALITGLRRHCPLGISFRAHPSCRIAGSSFFFSLFQVALYSKLSREVLRLRNARRYDADAIGYSAKLLELNPEAREGGRAI